MKKQKKKIFSIVGARPQFVKLASLSGKLSRLYDHKIIHTGQHYDNLMSGIFFKQLTIPKINYNLQIGSGGHGEMTGQMLIALEKLFLRMKPDLVLVYGDTNSTLAGALAAVKCHIRVGHIEAGLRSFNMSMPEEVNRVMTDHISNILFAPTPLSVKNLKAEGIRNGVIHSGDLMYELIDNYRDYLKGNSRILSRFDLEKENYISMTIHRAGNVDQQENLTKIVNIISRLKDKVLFPVHPRTLKNLRKFKLLSTLKKLPNCTISEPLSYLDNLSVIMHARAVMTDSGGVQKESIFLKTACLTMRDETEWEETLGWGNHLVGLSYSKISSILKSDKLPVKPVRYKIKGEKPSDIIVDGISSLF